MSEQTREIAVATIKVPPRLRSTDAVAVDALALSIADNGLINPITVVSREGGHTLVAGAHRLAALRQLGHTTTQARVIDTALMSAQEVQDAMLAVELEENLVRRGLNQMALDVFTAQLVTLSHVRALRKQLKSDRTRPARRKALETKLTELDSLLHVRARTNVVSLTRITEHEIPATGNDTLTPVATRLGVSANYLAKSLSRIRRVGGYDVARLLMISDTTASQEAIEAYIYVREHNPRLAHKWRDKLLAHHRGDPRHASIPSIVLLAKELRDGRNETDLQSVRVDRTQFVRYARSRAATIASTTRQFVEELQSSPHFASLCKEADRLQRLADDMLTRIKQASEE